MCTDNNVDSGAGKMIGLPMGRRREKREGWWGRTLATAEGREDNGMAARVAGD